MTDLKDVLHFYLGCKIQHRFPDKSYNEGIKTLTASKLQQIADPETQDEKYWTSLKWWKPILRKLSDMSEEEKTEYNKRKQRKGYMAQIHADNTAWLISKGFDVFDLIPSGHAIEAKTLQP